MCAYLCVGGGGSGKHSPDPELPEPEAEVDPDADPGSELPMESVMLMVVVGSDPDAEPLPDAAPEADADADVSMAVDCTAVLSASADDVTLLVSSTALDSDLTKLVSNWTVRKHRKSLSRTSDHTFNTLHSFLFQPQQLVFERDGQCRPSDQTKLVTATRS